MAYAPLKRPEVSARPKQDKSPARRNNFDTCSRTQKEDAVGALRLEERPPSSDVLLRPQGRSFDSKATGAVTDRLSAPAQRTSVPQAKLEIGSVNDPLEREADRIADHVVSPLAGHTGATTSSELRVQRACTSCTEDDEVQMKPSSLGGRQRVSNTTLTRGINERTRHGGMPLSEPARRFMEPRFGRDFSNVRIHADLPDQRLAQMLPITPDGPETIASIGPDRSAHVGRPAMRSIAGLV